MRFSFLLLGIIYGRDAIRCLREKFLRQGTYEKKKTTLTLLTLCTAPLDWVVIDGLIIWSGDRQKKIGN